MSDSIGQQLKKAREERNLSVEKAEQLTRIRARYIQALESDDYSVMSSAAQARGFLRNYSEFLDINIDEILDELQRAQIPVETEQFSGPLPSVDKASPLPVKQDEEKSARPFLISMLARFRKSGSALKAESQEPVPEVEFVNPPEPVVVEEPKARGRKKKIDSEESKTKSVVKARKKKVESQETVVEPAAPVVIEEPVTEEINQIKEEAKPNFLSRFGSLFSIRVSKPNQPEESVVDQPVSAHVDEFKADAEIPQVEDEQAEIPNDANVAEPKPSLLARVIALARIRLTASGHAQAGLTKPNPKEEVEEIPEVIPAPAYDEPELPQQSAQEIFAEIGAELRKRRDLLSLTAEEVERHTRLRAAFIKAMEDGMFDKLPSPVQTRGMLTNYAAFLDLDADALLLRFADALQARHRMKYPDKPAGSKPPMDVVSALPFLRSYVAGDMLFGVLIVAMLFALAFWGVGRMIAIQTAEQALPTAPSIPEVLAGSPQATVVQLQTFIPAADTPFAQNGTPVELPTLAANVNVQLNIVAMERAFMRVVVDGAEKFNGRVLPGTAYPYEAESQIEVLTGNGAALRITYNGRDLGLMGGYGEVVDRVYSIVGVATPTATLPPTPTNTPPITPTLSVTGTPVPTLTPTITITP